MTAIKLPSRSASLGLLALLVFQVAWRAHTFGPTLVIPKSGGLPRLQYFAAEPLDCDESAYAYIGRRIVSGDVLYRDLTENKPPLGYWLFALAAAIGGANETTIRLLAMPFAVGATAVLWLVARRYVGDRGAFLVGFLFIILDTDPYVFGNGSNLEHFINLFRIVSFALILASLENGIGRYGLLVGGGFVGAASLVKQVAGLDLPIDLAFVWLSNFGAERRSMQARLKDCGALLAGFVAAWLISAAVLIAQGAGRDALEDVFVYGRALATDTPPEPNSPPGWMRWLTGNAAPDGKLPPPFGGTDYLVWWGAGAWPLWLFSAVAVVGLGLSRKRSGQDAFAIAWTISAWAQVFAPRLYWQHYYMLAAPGAALVSVLWVERLISDLKSSQKNAKGLSLRAIAASLALLAALGWTVRIQVRDYLLVEPDEITSRYKGGRQWVALRDLAGELRRRSSIWPSPALYNWGWQSPLFVYGGFDCPTKHFFADPLLKSFADSDHPLIRPRVSRIVEDLRRNPPPMILSGYPPFPELRRFLNERYLPSRLVPSSPRGEGLWIDRERFGEFEAFKSAR